MRKLVTIRKVNKLLPIPNKDRIELAVIDGWSCIVKKGEFTEGSIGVFFEIDSFIPKSDKYSFLGKSTTHQGKQGYRIRTMKLAGAISQGLLLPISLFEELNSVTLNIGDNLTELLGVIKYDIDIAQQQSKGNSVTGKPAGNFPAFIPKTDQERIQNLPHLFETHKEIFFEETLKLDGSSMTAYKIEIKLPWYKQVLNKLFNIYNITHFGVCSRNLELKQPKLGDKPSNFWTASDKYNLHIDLPTGFAVQGEVLAPNIQGNYEKVSEVEFYIFSVFDITDQKYLTPTEARWFVSYYLPKAQYVPVVNPEVEIFKEITSFEQFQERVTSKSLSSSVWSEGRVYKACDGSISFKCISDKYLLKSGK